MEHRQEHRNHGRHEADVGKQKRKAQVKIEKD